MTEQTCIYENSSWASESKLKPDGITVLGPGVGKLDDMFELLDLSADDSNDGPDERLGSLITGQSNQNLVESYEPLEQGRVLEAVDQRAGYSTNTLTAKAEAHSEGKKIDSRSSRNELAAEGALDTSTSKNEDETHLAPAPSIEPEETITAEKTKARTNNKQNRRRKAIDPDILELIRSVCARTLDKRSLLNSKSASEAFGLERPLLRSSKPSGREAQFYTSEKILIDGVDYYVCLSWNAVQKIRLSKLVNSLERQAEESKAHSNTAAEESRKLSEEAEPEYCTLARRLYKAIANKDQLFEKRYSHDMYGINGALIIHKLPTGKDAQLYRPISLDDEQLYIYTKWKPFNTMKLKNAVNRAEKDKK